MWRCQRHQKKRSRKLGKGNLQGRKHPVIPSNGKSTKELMIREIYIPQQAILVLTGHDPT